MLFLLLLLSLLLPMLRCVLLLRQPYGLCAMVSQCMPWINQGMGRAVAMPAVPCSLVIRMVSLLCAAIVIIETSERSGVDDDVASRNCEKCVGACATC